MRTKIRKVIIVIGLSLVLVVVFGFLTLRRPTSLIEASLLRMAPLGSSKEQVFHAIEAKGWKHSAFREVGFLKQETTQAAKVVGAKSIDAHLGEYGIFLSTSVDAFWGFDQNGRLIEVWVWKTIDAP